MSLKDREKALEIIDSTVRKFYTSSDPKYPNITISNYILNKLFKAGYLNDKILVHADEVKDELDQAVFKCKVEE